MKKKLLWIPAILLLGLLALYLWPEMPQHIDPPYTLSPICAADLDILLGGDSAVLESFLESKCFSGRFPTEAAMVGRFAQPLLRSGYPVPADDAQEFSLSWYVGARHVFSFYDGKIQYNFQIDQEKTPFRLPVFAAAIYKIGNREVQFYRGKGCIVGEFTSNGYLVRVTVRGYDKLEDISFDHILWHEPQPSEQ
jgi:hypothetical protein